MLKHVEIAATPPGRRSLLANARDNITISPYVRRQQRYNRRQTVPASADRGEEAQHEDDWLDGDGVDAASRGGGGNEGGARAHEQPPSAYLFVSNADNG